MKALSKTEAFRQAHDDVVVFKLSKSSREVKTFDYRRGAWATTGPVSVAQSKLEYRTALIAGTLTLMGYLDAKLYVQRALELMQKHLEPINLKSLLASSLKEAEY